MFVKGEMNINEESNLENRSKLNSCVYDVCLIL